MSVVLDSNLWISAFIFRGKPLELVEMGLDSLVDIAVSQSIIDETLRVMNDKICGQTGLELCSKCHGDPSVTSNNSNGGQITSPRFLQSNTPDARFFQFSLKYLF